MKARAILKESYYGKTLASVNLQGKGIIDCDRKVADYATELKADYWEIQYNCHFDNAQKLVSGKNGIRIL